MNRAALKWTLFGCAIVYLALTLIGLTDSGETKPFRGVLWAAILGLAVYLLATRKGRKK